MQSAEMPSMRSMHILACVVWPPASTSAVQDECTGVQNLTATCMHNNNIIIAWLTVHINTMHVYTTPGVLNYIPYA